MSTPVAPLSCRGFVSILKQRKWLWTIPAGTIALLAAGYAFLRPEQWQASQRLVVREEVAGSISRQGRFDSADAMKTAQETILEISKSSEVVSGALTSIGPPAGRQSTRPWPTPAELEAARSTIGVAAPKGSEFGKTEVIYIAVLAESRPRAIALASAVCDQLEARLKELRNRKYESIIGELEKSVSIAQAGLRTATGKLEQMEIEVGSDLGELRILNDSGAGDSNLRAALNQIENELRQAQTTHAANQQLQSHLQAAMQDEKRLVATPNRLLESQPSLRRLKDGLVDAQLRTAELSGTMSHEHPKVRAAIAAEQIVRQDLHKELEVAVRGLDTELRVGQSQITALELQRDRVKQRLDKLAGIRAGYGNQVAEVRQASEILQKAQRDLSEAKASLTASATSSLLTRIEAPHAANRPVGPDTAQILLCGVLGGLACGIGLVFLTTPQVITQGRRFTDQLRFGRRASDRSQQSSDRHQPVAGVVNSGDRRAGGDRRNIA